jgi:hypothetical protein
LTARRINRVLIAGLRDATTVEIPWESRQALLDRLRREGDADPIIATFEAVGTTSPVKLPKEAKRRLLDTCEAWLYHAVMSMTSVAMLPRLRAAA